MTSYYFTPDHDMFRESFRDFLEKEVRPNLNQWEEDGQFPPESAKSSARQVSSTSSK